MENQLRGKVLENLQQRGEWGELRGGGSEKEPTKDTYCYNLF